MFVYNVTDIIKHKMTLDNNIIIQQNQHTHEKDMQHIDHQHENKKNNKEKKYFYRNLRRELYWNIIDICIIIKDSLR